MQIVAPTVDVNEPEAQAEYPVEPEAPPELEYEP